MPVQRTAILHIGPFKTGSTSIQYFLGKNDDRLMRQGVCFARSPGRPNNVSLAVYALDDHRMTGLINRLQLQKKEDRDQYNEEFKASFNAEMRGLPDHTKRVIFSNEHCSGLIMEREIRALRRLLDPYFSSFIIIAYLRRQDRRIISDYTEKLRGGYTEHFDLIDYFPAEGLDYKKFLDRWALVFGNSAIIPRIFSKENFVNENLIDDFCAAAGIAPTAEFERPAVHNTGLSHRAVMFLRSFNCHVPSYINETRNSAYVNLLQVLAKEFSGHGIELDRASALHLLDRYEESNRQVSITYLNKNKNLFSNNLSSYSKTKPDELSFNDGVEMAAYLWCEQCKIIEDHKEEIRKLTAILDRKFEQHSKNLKEVRIWAKEILCYDKTNDVYYPTLLDEFMKCYEELLTLRERVNDLLSATSKKQGTD